MVFAVVLPTNHALGRFLLFTQYNATVEHHLKCKALLRQGTERQCKRLRVTKSKEKQYATTLYI